LFILGVETRPDSRLPWVTWGLIAANLLVFGLQVHLGDRFNYGYSLVPAEIAKGRDLVKPQHVKFRVPMRTSTRVRGRSQVYYRVEWVTIPQYPGPRPIQLTLLTSMFMHAGWIHLLGNMWFLLVFGGHIEHALRQGLFLVFYLVCGVAAGLAHVLVDPTSVIPCMGASGAISGVLAAYLSIYPFSKVKIWLGIWFGVLKVPAVVVLGIWFALQYASGALSVLSGEVHGGVAYWAHIGGFVVGLLFIWGMIWYLRAQVAGQTDREPEPEPPPEPPPELDPYAIFLPVSPRSK
jgi:membrane associated rhomboid family serine protease